MLQRPLEMTKENETLANKLIVSVNRAKMVVDNMLKNSRLPSSQPIDQQEAGRSPRLGLGAKFIPHSQVAKYDPKIKRILTDPKLKTAKAETKHDSDDEVDNSKYALSGKNSIRSTKK